MANLCSYYYDHFYVQYLVKLCPSIIFDHCKPILAQEMSIPYRNYFHYVPKMKPNFVGRMKAFRFI